jgi:RNA polymerase-binding transcription factor DksA
MTDTEPMSVDPRFEASTSEEMAATETEGMQAEGMQAEGAGEVASEAAATDQASSGDKPGDERAEAVQLRVELDDVEAALERLDAGTYGTCQVCGTELADGELERQPQARLCVEHSG